MAITDPDRPVPLDHPEGKPWRIGSRAWPVCRRRSLASCACVPPTPRRAAPVRDEIGGESRWGAAPSIVQVAPIKRPGAISARATAQFFLITISLHLLLRHVNMKKLPTDKTSGRYKLPTGEELRAGSVHRKVRDCLMLARERIGRIP